MLVPAIATTMSGTTRGSQKPETDCHQNHHSAGERRGEPASANCGRHHDDARPRAYDCDIHKFLRCAPGNVEPTRPIAAERRSRLAASVADASVVGAVVQLRRFAFRRCPHQDFIPVQARNGLTTTFERSSQWTHSARPRRQHCASRLVTQHARRRAIHHCETATRSQLKRASSRGLMVRRRYSNGRVSPWTTTRVKFGRPRGLSAV